MNIIIPYSQHVLRVFLLFMLAAAFYGCEDDDESPAVSGDLLVAWTSDSGDGSLDAMTTRQPFRFEGESVPIGADAVLRCSEGDLYVLSQRDGNVSIVEPRTQDSQTIASLGAGEPVDIAVVEPETAYVTRRTATHLLRLDITSGATSDAVDLSAYADDDGIPDLGMMAVHDGRLYVQILRISKGEPFGFAPPAYIAVIDLETEALVDTDPDTPGVQAIKLEGTAPKHKMQVMEETDELFVSASGAFFDEGGIEVIDLETLQSKGLIVRESDGEVGADLGPFVMVNPDEGFLVFSTDLDFSSHLRAFSREGGVEPGPDLHVSVGYGAPSLELDAPGDTLFFPDGQDSSRRIRVFDVATGIQLTPAPIATEGRPSDVLRACSG